VRTTAVLPIKSFARAKQRLGDAVGAVEREQLAAAMVSDVLAALAAVPEIAEVVVVTAEPLAARAAEEAGAAVVDDPEESGQSAAAARGIEAALGRGAERALLVPGDCPAVEPEELSRLIARGGGSPSVVIVPDRHGSGTNALLLTPPHAVAPSFGTGSFARHAATAYAAGASVKVCELPSLGLDVDTPDDLAALRTALEARPETAARTRAVLDRLVVPAGGC
jgi:2-phospho-L-lactate guanylyltransferase